MGVCATNCYFLYREGGTKAVVVDPAENGAGIFKLLSEKDFTVEAILLTHGHFDHIGGAAELKKASGAKVYALAEEKADAAITVKRAVSYSPAIRCLRNRSAEQISRPAA